MAGLSPQIVTETLHGLIVLAQPPFIPTHIEILTTAEGRRRAIETLLDPGTGAFFAFCRDYGLADLTDALTADHVLAMPDPRGVPLEDIRTADDSGAAANAIVARIRTLTRDADCALHVSIAGGRKTMGFLAGHALSLFGRLSHVLVDEPFLTLPDFFYPPPHPRRLHDRSGKAIDTAAARLTLVDIPFLRLRGQLPPAVVQADARSYTETIALAQAALDPALEIDPPRRLARFGGQTVRLPPAELAWLTWMAARHCDPALPHGGALHWSEVLRPDEILFHYERVRPSQRDVVRMRKALEEGGLQELFEQRTAKVRDGLGPAAEPYLLRSDGRRPISRTGLKLSPDRIRIIA